MLGSNYYKLNYGPPTIGTDTTDMTTFEQILAADGAPHSAALQDRGRYQSKGAHVPFARYIDPGLVQAEIDNIWSKCWTVACREEDIPNVGDRVRYDMVDTSYMIVRTATDTVKAFYNSCRHRGRLLCDGKANGDRIQCGFHGWTWTLDGELAWVPSRQDFPYVKNVKYGLIEVRVERWGGQVFINPDPKAAPLPAALGVLTEHFAESPLDQRFTAVLMHKKIRANWKLTQEAFMEAYHMVATHWDALPFSGDANTLYDCWASENNEYCVSRVLTPLAVPSPFVKREVSNEKALEAFVRNLGYTGESPKGQDTGKLRGFAAELRRKELAGMFGHNFDGMPTCQIIDAVKYYMFPNFHPWWGEGVPLWYRFLPIGRDPNQCLMEVRLLLPLPKSGPRPPVPTPIVVDFDQSCTEIKELSFLGHIFDQDMGNLQYVQAGIKAAPQDRASCTLAQYQEAPITHFHEIYAKRMHLT
jgi:phenylpropionate dioxygenase-like ring-hydroxylating dioxygenase large terminal subunit